MVRKLPSICDFIKGKTVLSDCFRTKWKSYYALRTDFGALHHLSTISFERTEIQRKSTI